LIITLLFYLIFTDFTIHHRFWFSAPCFVVSYLS